MREPFFKRSFGYLSHNRINPSTVTWTINCINILGSKSPSLDRLMVPSLKLGLSRPGDFFGSTMFIISLAIKAALIINKAIKLSNEAFINISVLYGAHGNLGHSLVNVNKANQVKAKLVPSSGK